MASEICPVILGILVTLSHLLSEKKRTGFEGGCESHQVMWGIALSFPAMVCQCQLWDLGTIHQGEGRAVDYAEFSFTAVISFIWP